LTGTLFVFMAAIVVIAGLLGRRRVKSAVDGERPVTGDSRPWEISEEDWKTGDSDDDPLDEDEIRSAEDEFWESDWDPPEEWRP
jgi:hypothetical protein